MSAKLHPSVIQAIKDDLSLGEFSEQEIAKRNKCSHGAVQYYKRGGKEHKAKKQYYYERYSLKREVAAPAPFVMPAPHALPWVTREMLTGARAPVARVRS